MNRLLDDVDYDSYRDMMEGEGPAPLICTSCGYVGTDVWPLQLASDLALCQRCGDADEHLFWCEKCEHYCDEEMRISADEDSCIDCYAAASSNIHDQLSGER